jgi:cysteinyl-tRNA synthetase
MSIRLYNTLTRRKEEFAPIKEGKVGIYSCGPTVYGPPHIGNYSSFIFADVLKRYLRYRGFEVTHVMNITDVDDKTIRESRKAGKSLEEFTGSYADYFLEGLKKLNCVPAEVYPRATHHIEDMTALVEKLLENGLAYESGGSVYFRVSAFDKYGQLARLDPEGLRSGGSGRVDRDEYDRESVRDFALWKAWSEEDGDVFWETPVGKGRPGWHIECSAMSMKYLGETFDIHTGGVDLIFPHHENEIAQSEGATGKKFVNYWLHRAFVNFEGEKMAKSLGNVYSVEGLADSPGGIKAYRYLVTTGHYRAPIQFSKASMKAASAGLQGLLELKERLEQNKKSAESEDDEAAELVGSARESFIKHMDDDLNAPRAIAVVHDLARELNKRIDGGSLGAKGAEEALGFLAEVDQVFGIFSFDEERKLTSEQEELIEKRTAARKAKDFAEADRIRDLLLEQGIQLKDTPEGVRLTFVD